jgi:uncharacterized protein YndB with AHSA1/START domain
LGRGVIEMGMRNVLKWPLRLVFALIGVVAIIAAFGALLPRDHVASRIGTYQVPPDKVWAAIADVDAMPSWRIGLKSVTRLPDANGMPAHIEDTAAGKLKIETQAMEPPRKLVNRIGGDNLPFGGTWTFDVTPTADGSTVRITENGYVTNPIFRFVARFVMGYTSEMDKYLTGLALHFGEKPQIGD